MRTIATVLAFVMLGLSVDAAPNSAAAATPPDFTKGGKRDESHDWTLGPTGARGWLYTARGHSRDARQILVTAIAKGSPADGALVVGDVILGADGKPFTGDARIQFSNAVAIAESEKGGGKLQLLRWREGKSDVVTLKLAVLGSYSVTAPYDCPKSKRIFELGCASLAKRMADPSYGRSLNPIPRSLNAMALLATGNKEYLPILKREAEWAAGFTTNGYLSWYYGYLLTYVAEYVMATGDQSVVPGMKRLAMETAKGQSAVGTWGHKFAEPTGNLSGYGCMNQPGISLAIGMIMAREAGLKEPELDRAIAKAATFLRWYVNKGAVPYGDHLPFPAHEDNGKCASAAVMFDLLGDREAAEFFAKMSTAAYNERERGHTGNYFNMLWALLGNARCGPIAVGAYMKEHGWYYDLARGWDGQFLYQGSPVGEEEHNKYTGWDSSGSYLLAYGLPLKSLRITGKKPFSVPALNAAQAAEVIAAGSDYTYKGDPDQYEKRTPEQLIAGLSSWSPTVRKHSAEALGKKQGDFVPVLLKLLASKNRDARYGAIEALGCLGQRADAAAPQLREALKETDPWIQCLAADAIKELGPQARKDSVSDLLSVTVRTNAADPRRHAALFASLALFSNYPGKRGPKSILQDSLEGVDRAQLYPAIKSLLQHEDSIARNAPHSVYDNLTDSDLVALLPAITKAIERIAPSNEMFGDGARLAGLDLLSRLRIREGMDLCITVMEPERWGEKNRTRECLNYLVRYGAHAKAMLPKLQETRIYLAKVKKVSPDHLAYFDKQIAAIEASTATPTLVNLSEFKSRSTN